MRTKKSDKKDIVKKVVETIGNNPIDNVPELREQQNIIPPFEAIEVEQQKSAFEIIPGMTVEEMKAMFFNENALIEPPYKIWQLNSKGYRYYYRFDDNGNPEFFPSVTTILSQTMPKSEFLIKWIAEKGIDEAERQKNDRASYGTFMHAAFEELLINRSYDLDNLKNKLKEYIEVQRLPSDFIYNADELKKDVLSFAQFVLDYDVRPLAVEIALVHPNYGYAGMIDCPCTMRERIGSDNRINAIIDFKSGRKGFYEEAEIQLHMYKDMWNINFEKYQINKVFNFSPKDWRKSPTYNLKDQTDSPNAKKIPALLELAAIEDGKKDNIFTSVSGAIMLDESPDLNNNVISLTLSELIKSKAPKEKMPDENISVKVEDIEPKNESGKKTVSNKAIKKANKTGKKPHKDKTSKKQASVPTKVENSKKEAEKADKKKLLNDEPDI